MLTNEGIIRQLK